MTVRPFPLHPHPEVFVLAANPSGVGVRVVASGGHRQLPCSITDSAIFREALNSFHAKREAHGWFDGATLPVVDIQMEENAFTLSCAVDCYSRGFALSAWARKNFEDGLEPAVLPVEFAPGANCGVDVALISSDGRVFLNQRSFKVEKYPGYWTLGFGEGLEHSDLGTNDLGAACARCLTEEIAMPSNLLSIEGVKFLTVAVVREAASGTWNSYCIVDLREARSPCFDHISILQGMTRANDSWESQALLPLAPAVLTEFLGTVPTTPGTQLFTELLLAYLAQ